MVKRLPEFDPRFETDDPMLATAALYAGAPEPKVVVLAGKGPVLRFDAKHPTLADGLLPLAKGAMPFDTGPFEEAKSRIAAIIQQEVLKIHGAE